MKDRSRIVPTATATGGDIGLSNSSLKLITLSLYSGYLSKSEKVHPAHAPTAMVKSSSLLFVLFFAFLFHLEPFSLRLLLVILLISFGVFLMVFNTTDISISGLIMVFCASALGGLRWALTEVVMHKKAMGLSNPFATIFWLAPVMAVCLGFVSLILEGWGVVFRSYHWQGAFGVVRTVGVIALPGSMAFAMVASEYL
jgi:solute carrier family 35 protein C2